MKEVARMNAYQIIMVCIAIVTLILKLIEFILDLTRK